MLYPNRTQHLWQPSRRKGAVLPSPNRSSKNGYVILDVLKGFLSGILTLAILGLLFVVVVQAVRLS